MRVVFGPEVFGQRYGGISRYFVELHRRMPALGVSSMILAGIHHNAYLRGVDGVRGVRAPDLLQKERLRGLREGINDLVAVGHVRGEGSTAVYHQTYYGGSVGRRHRGPCVVTAYDLVHAKFPKYFPDDDPTVAQQRLAFAHADLILSISNTTKADLQEIFGIAASRIVVTHLGVTSPGATTASVSAVTRPFLLYVGQRYGYKNWEQFVRAYTASPLAGELQVVCTGEPFTTAEQQWLVELGRNRDVVHLSADDTVMDALYREAAAFVYPSLYEGFGLPPLEAMARGCPVMASSAGAIPEVLGDAAVYADPHDVDSMAKALTEVVRPERREELASAGRGLASTYSWERTAAQTAAAYRSLR